jgi:hypothetical protein
MPNETNALAVRLAPAAPAALNDGDYRALCAALAATARGRSFLDEYARRNRSADTKVLLDALARLEAHVRADGTAADRMRDQLRMLLIAIRLARPEIDAATVPVRASKLRTLLDLLERRLDDMAEPKAAGAALAEPEAEGARAWIEVVPPPDEPELPIPSPPALPPTIALVGTAAALPSPFVTPAPAKADAGEAAAMTEPAPPPADPLAALMALSAEERQALFT